MGRDTVEILTAAPLPYLLVNVKAIQLQKLSLGDIKTIWTIS